MTFYAEICVKCRHGTDPATQCGRSGCTLAGARPHQHCFLGCYCGVQGCDTSTISVVVPTCERCGRAPAARGYTLCRDCGPSTTDTATP